MSEFREKRKNDFEREEEKVVYDATNLIKISQITLNKENPSVEDVLDLVTRTEDSDEYKSLLKREIAVQIKGKDRVLGSVVASTQEAVAMAAPEEDNDHEVSMGNLIDSFVNGLKCAFTVTREQVLERFATALTLEKFENLMYWQLSGHELDVTGVTETGELEFDTCSANSPSGGVTYFKAEELARDNGANLMSFKKYRWLTENVILDEKTCSWLDTPGVGRGGYCILVAKDFAMKIKNYDKYNSFYHPTDFYARASFRVSLTV